MKRQFTALSGMAMVLIVLNHTIELGTGIPLRYGLPEVRGTARAILDLLKALGMFAVPTFLFISGAFVSYVARGEPRRLAIRFLAGAFKHVWWPYFIWSLSFYALIFLQFGERYDVAGYVKNLVVGYPFHFVPLLLLFYFLSPPLVRIAERHGLGLIAAVAAYQLLALAALRGDLLPGKAHLICPPVVGRTLSQWAIYFPLGLVYGMHMKSLGSRLDKARWGLVALAAAGFLVRLLQANGFAPAQMVVELAPVGLVLLLPGVNRGSIPFLGTMESIGKRSYGLYLTNLIVLDGILWAVATLEPDLLRHRLLLLPALFAAGLWIPMLIMNGTARLAGKGVLRYVFG